MLVRREASLVGRTLTLSAQSPEQGHCVEEGRQGTVQRRLSSLLDRACVHKLRNDFWKRWWKSHAAAALEEAGPETHDAVPVIPARLL